MVRPTQHAAPSAPEGACGEDLAAFFYGIGIVGLEVLRVSRWPLGQVISTACASVSCPIQKSGSVRFASSSLSRSGRSASFPPAARAHPHFGADAVAVRVRADRPDADGVRAAAAHVVEEVRRAAVGGHEDVGAPSLSMSACAAPRATNFRVKPKGLPAS